MRADEVKAGDVFLVTREAAREDAKTYESSPGHVYIRFEDGTVRGRIVYFPRTRTLRVRRP